MSDGFKLGKIKLGVATSSTQIEGGKCKSNWTQWHHAGHIKDNANPEIACRHEKLMEDDTKLMRDMGLEIYRLSIEWAKIQPAINVFNGEAITYYLNEIRLLKSYGIEPLVTLHHFSNPLWFEEMGGFEHPDAVKIFLKFTEYVTETFKDEVSEYCTINEPNVYATEGYVFGTFPPGVKKIKRGIKVMEVLSLIHIGAYELIHKIRKNAGYSDTRVGFANHLRVFKSSGGLISNKATKYMENAFQTAVTRAFNTGEFKKPFSPHPEIEVKKYYDYIGINYYSRSFIKGLKVLTMPNTPINDLGWEIYAEGLKLLVEEQFKLYPAPVYITENGTADKDDKFRAQYIYDHLKALTECGEKVEKYYHWTFYDNFEWVDGNTAKFGIVETNFDDFSRKPRKSGEFFSEIIKNNGVNSEMIEKYGIKI